ncbi:MAG: hypothetical protein HFJ46_02660 [Clostridia bacterium]|nr:hypothetical protein [Clostridia bacterium]
MNNNLKVLNEIHKGLIMGMESISVIKSKVEEPEFRTLLNNQYSEYSNILEKVNNKFEKYNEKADDTTPIEKIMGWTSIQFDTLTDHSASKISDMLIRGTTMGIIEGRKMLNTNLSVDNEVTNILQEFVDMQEEDIEKLKEWL